MRVIAGRVGGTRLRAPRGRRVRPTSDRAKETLFNVIGPRLPGTRVLDLFAGSGALGIEALSRGAAFAVFVECRRDAASAIRENLERCRLQEDAVLLVAPWRRAIGRLQGKAPYDVVLLDPPWESGDPAAALAAVTTVSLVAADALAVIEHPAGEGPPEIDGWSRYRELEVGGTGFALYARAAEEPALADDGLGS